MDGIKSILESSCQIKTGVLSLRFPSPNLLGLVKSLVCWGMGRYNPIHPSSLHYTNLIQFHIQYIVLGADDARVVSGRAEK